MSKPSRIPKPAGASLVAAARLMGGPLCTLLSVVHEAILLVDDAQKVIGFNHAAEALLGCRASSALGRPLERFVPVAARAAHAGQVRRFTDSADVRRRMAPGRRVMALHGDGHEVPVEVTLSRVDVMVDGVMRHWSAALLRDLTLEDSLRGEIDTLTRRLYAALDATPVAVWIAEDEHIFYANAIAAHLVGEADAAALHGRRLGDWLTEPTLLALRAARRGGETGPTVRVAGQLRQRGGALREIEAVVAPLPDHGHAVVQMVLEDVTERRRASAELERSGRELRRLQANVVEAREEERRRIARELHDELGQRLSALKMEVGALAARAGLPAHEAPLAGMLVMLDETVAAVRRIASDLRPLMLDDLGLNAAIEWLARDTARRTGIEVEVQLGELAEPPDNRLATALYRMVQEGLTNVIRHAQARHVEVQLRQQRGAVVLSVADDGVGLPEAGTLRDDAYGLLGMRERAAMLGGSLEMQNVAGGGARLTVRMPWRRQGRRTR
ncbi:MAG: PAS domain S-box protein [Rubrivivax sp.]|nr:PAS domain S-box protein [Rubrivivax sp.]